MLIKDEVTHYIHNIQNKYCEHNKQSFIIRFIYFIANLTKLELLLIFIILFSFSMFSFNYNSDRVHLIDESNKILIKEIKDKDDKLVSKELQIQTLIYDKPKTEVLIKTYEDKLVEWVYNNSKVTSKEDCVEIVKEALLTKHPFLVLSIFRPESNFNPKAISNKDCKGLGQIHPIHTDSLIENKIISSVRDLYQISNNVKATDYVISEKLRFSDNNIHKAIDLYLGESDVDYRQKIYETFLELNLVFNTGELTGIVRGKK